MVVLVVVVIVVLAVVVLGEDVFSAVVGGVGEVVVMQFEVMSPQVYSHLK